MANATQNFSLTIDGGPPPWPHFECSGSGWAWHGDDKLRRCFSGTVAVDAKIVALAIDNRGLPGVDRILAIAALRKVTTMAVVRRIFREECPACGANHLEVAEQSIRAAERIVHPGAIDVLREAGVPVDLLRRARIIRRMDDPPKDQDEEKRRERAMRYIPFCESNPSKTLAAQIAFAVQYGMRRSYGTGS